MASDWFERFSRQYHLKRSFKFMVRGIIWDIIVAFFISPLVFEKIDFFLLLISI